MSDSARPGNEPAELDYTWMDAIENVLDAQIDQREDLEATFEDFEVDIPLRYGEDPPRGRWGFDGTVRINVDGMRGGLVEWLEYWSSREQ